MLFPEVERGHKSWHVALLVSAGGVRRGLQQQRGEPGEACRWARAAHKPRPFLAPPPLPSTWAKPSSRPGTRATLWWHRCHSRPGPQAWERAWLRTDLRRERLAGPLPAPRAVLPWKGVGTTRLKSQVRGAVGATLIAALKPLGGAAAQPPQNSSGSSTINYF